MSTPCYCYYTENQKKVVLKEASKTEVDNALNELGMLSAVTNSRREYLQELSARAVSGPSSVYVLQMNPKYVADFTFSSSASVSQVEESLEFIPQSTYELHTPWKMSDIHERRRMLRDKPYIIRSRSKVKVASCDIKATLFPSSSSETNNGTTSTANSISRQDSGNKSNPGSPVKSQKNVTNSGCSIIRSRSLDDLEIGNLSLNDCCSNEAGKAEIDTVSQRISNLHVS